MFATGALNEIIQSKKPYPGMRLSVQLGANKQWSVYTVDPPPAERPVAPTSAETRAPAATQGAATRPQIDMPVKGPGWGALRIALFSAIGDATEAEKYAAGKGMSLRFDAADIRAMSITGVIGMQQGGR
jgi:hypothetical protein